VLVLLVVLVALALLAYLVWALIAARKVSGQFSIELPCNPESAVGYLWPHVVGVMHDYGYRLDSQGSVGIVFANTYRPAWLALPCILLFPLGLLSLLYRKTADVTFNFVPAPTGGTTVHISGSGSNPFWLNLQGRLDTLAAS